MVRLLLTLILACVTSLQACPEPINIHYQNYEGPVILHTGNCDNQQQRCQGNQQPGYYDNQQYGYYGNQYKQHGCCETECTCVSKHSHVPYAYGSVATNVACGCSPVAETKPLVYCVCNKYGSNGHSDYCGGNQGHQDYRKCQGKYSGC